MVAQSLGRGVCSAPLRGVSAMPETLWSGDFLAGALPSGMSFSRASDGGYFDGSGTWQVAGSGVPRFDHDPVTLMPRGLLLEEARTNTVRNGDMTGGTNGQIGGGGSWPTNWGVGASVGATITRVGTGTEFGMRYMELRFSGNTTSAGSMLIRGETSSVAASAGQTWTVSCHLRITGGGTANVTAAGLRVEERNSSGGAISNTSTDGLIDLGSTALQRVSVTRTLTNAGTHFVLPDVRVALAFGAVDFTLRIYALQMEQGAFATSYIATTGTAAASRAADALSLPLAGRLEGSLVADSVACSVAADMAIAGVSDSSSAAMISVGGAASGAKLSGVVADGGSTQASLAADGAWAAGQPKKVGIAWRQDDFALAAGSVLAHDAAGTVPETSQLDIGRAGDAASGLFNGWVRRVDLYRHRLENGRLQELVKG